MKKIIRYGLVGLLTTIINVLVDFSLRFAGMSFYISMIIAWIVSVTFAFFGNKNIVFKNKNNNYFSLYSKFASGRLTTLFIEEIASFVMNDVFLCNQYLSKFIIQFIIIIINFFLGILIFDKQKEETK